MFQNQTLNFENSEFVFFFFSFWKLANNSNIYIGTLKTMSKKLEKNYHNFLKQKTKWLLYDASVITNTPSLFSFYCLQNEVFSH